jgi:hypothetical protein
MQTITLTKGYVAFVDDEDYPKVSCYKWTAAVRKTATHTRVYAYRAVEGYSILLHRSVMELSPEDPREVDHKDSNGLNCQKYNLRICTRSQNLGNMRKRMNTSSKYKGVSKTPTAWSAEIMCRGKRTRKAGFLTEMEAAKFYDSLALSYFGEFARMNFTQGGDK